MGERGTSLYEASFRERWSTAIFSCLFSTAYSSNVLPWDWGTCARESRIVVPAILCVIGTIVSVRDVGTSSPPTKKNDSEPKSRGVPSSGAVAKARG